MIPNCKTIEWEVLYDDSGGNSYAAGISKRWIDL
jgi:hypothetical protein